MTGYVWVYMFFKFLLDLRENDPGAFNFFCNYRECMVATYLASTNEIYSLCRGAVLSQLLKVCICDRCVKLYSLDIGNMQSLKNAKRYTQCKLKCDPT